MEPYTEAIGSSTSSLLKVRAIPCPYSEENAEALNIFAEKVKPLARRIILAVPNRFKGQQPPQVFFIENENFLDQPRNIGSFAALEKLNTESSLWKYFTQHASLFDYVESIYNILVISVKGKGYYFCMFPFDYVQPVVVTELLN